MMCIFFLCCCGDVNSEDHREGNRAREVALEWPLGADTVADFLMFTFRFHVLFAVTQL